MAGHRRIQERFTFASRTVHHHRIRPVLELLEGRALLTTFTVNSLGDVGSGSGDAGDLRYCINQANANSQANTIVFDSTVFKTPQTITLSGGELELEDTAGTQTITGPAAGVTISGGGKTLIFQVGRGVAASISDLIISDGDGGVINDGTATLTDCTISGNTSEGGGGLNNSGTVTLTNCTLSGNTASNPIYGGYYEGTVNLAAGGGVFNSGTATLTGCTISGNNAAGGGGGGVYNSGPGYNSGPAKLTMTDCTVVGNSAISYDGEFTFGGGAVENKGTANLTDCTISGNFAGGGLEDAEAESGILYATANLTDTIVAGNTDFDINGSNFSGASNLIGTGGSGGLVNGVDGNIVLTSLNDLGLAPLANNGGPTQTMALLPGSAAIGAGVIADDPGTTTPITTDQRGDPLDTPKPDIGAYQTQGDSTLITPTFSGISNPSITYGTSSVTISGALKNGSQAPVGETVAVTLDGVKQPATIGSGGAFATTFTFDSPELTVSQSPYTVNCTYTSDGTFASASTSSTLTVDPASLTITAKPDTKVYGTADPALAYTATGFEFSDTAASVLTGNLARAQAGTLAGEQAGGYAIGQGTLAADSNYTISFTGNTLTIAPAPLTVTANPRSKVYGRDDPTLTFTAAGLIDTTVEGVTIDDTAARALAGHLARARVGSSAGEQVGAYAITQGTLAASDYTITFTGNTLTITAAPLTVTANPQTKVYGSNDPALTVTPTGLVDTTVDGVTIDDTAATVLSGQLARAAGQTVAGGPYAITQGTLAADSDYTMSFMGSTLKITSATLTIAAKPETKVYGSADPTLAYTASGFQYSDTAATVLTGHLTRAAGQTVSGSPYAIGQGTLAANSNYTIHFIGSSLSITKATPTVTVSDPGGTYTGKPFPATALVTGVAGTAAASLEGVTPTLTYYAGSGTSGKNLGSTTPSAVGTYTVVAHFAGSVDYTAATSKPTTFVIAPAGGATSGTNTESVSQAATAIVLVPHPILNGKKKVEAVGLTVEIKPLAPGGGVPTGQVTIDFVKKQGKKVKVMTLGTAALTGGEATLTFKPNQVLDKPLTIVYSGDPDFLASTIITPKLTR